MNKKEIVRAITREVCAYVKSLGYEVEDDGFHGSLTFIKYDDNKTTNTDDWIEWNRSYQEAVCVNWASDECKADCEAIDAHMKPIIEHYNNQYTPKRVMA